MLCGERAHGKILSWLQDYNIRMTLLEITPGTDLDADDEMKALGVLFPLLEMGQ